MERLDEYKVLTENIRYYRMKANLTQEQLAEKSDLSVSYIKQLESGKEFKNITFNSFSKIAKALNISVKQLFTENNKLGV